MIVGEVSAAPHRETSIRYSAVFKTLPMPVGYSHPPVSVSRTLSLAGFQVTTIGRFCVIAEGTFP
jgi:hypothetical protein